MVTRILVLDGHPDPDRSRFCHALAQAYVDSARARGKDARHIVLADISTPALESAEEFAKPPEQPEILAARADMEWAQHLVIVSPLWMGSLPAKLRAFFEQVARGGFVAATVGKKQRLHGKTARIILTMGMPALVYRVVFGAHGLQSWKRSILGFAGVGPIRETLFGAIEAVGRKTQERRLALVRRLGELGR